MTLDQRAEYIREVILAVYGKEPEVAPVSNADWSIIDNWMSKGIPLAIVLQAVEQMEKHPSVRYIQRAVEEEQDRVQRSRTN